MGITGTATLPRAFVKHTRIMHTLICTLLRMTCEFSVGLLLNTISLLNGSNLISAESLNPTPSSDKTLSTLLEPWPLSKLYTLSP